MDMLPAINQLAEPLSAVERRLATPEGAPPEPGPAACWRRRPTRPTGWAPAPGGDVPRRGAGLLGAPVSVEDTPDFLFWHYGPEQSVVFGQDPRARTGLARVFP